MLERNGQRGTLLSFQMKSRFRAAASVLKTFVVVRIEADTRRGGMEV